ncbi:MAG: hypothetical protein AVDCRST_MAG41-1450 [uncultured Corynebacteriales bacterium]|uniref:Uncharacterized protein n=1 Tax=uncultured Mycobacteriales bacterium TaxID=581187 RepID=A0A6J4I4R9_9ACTN|nr:MAG: hypothetical protein AVDCRST_MAG41-1450 [uncultured Corynebacteriales bacterium]
MMTPVPRGEAGLPHGLRGRPAHADGIGRARSVGGDLLARVAGRRRAHGGEVDPDAGRVVPAAAGVGPQAHQAQGPGRPLPGRQRTADAGRVDGRRAQVTARLRGGSPAAVPNRDDSRSGRGLLDRGEPGDHHGHGRRDPAPRSVADVSAVRPADEREVAHRLVRILVVQGRSAAGEYPLTWAARRPTCRGGLDRWPAAVSRLLRRATGGTGGGRRNRRRRPGRLGRGRAGSGSRPGRSRVDRTGGARQEREHHRCAARGQEGEPGPMRTHVASVRIEVPRHDERRIAAVIPAGAGRRCQALPGTVRRLP